MLNLKVSLLVAGEELAEISVVVAPHLHVENLRVSSSRLGDEVVHEQVEDFAANFVELALDLLAVPLDQVEVLAAFILLLVLDGRDGPPSRPARADCVLEGNTEQVALFVGKLALLQS